MAAPTGVNEGIPQEPPEDGPAHPEIVQAPAVEPESAASLEASQAEGALAGAMLAGAGGPDRDAGEAGRRASPLAVAGVILGIVVLAGAAVAVLAVITHGFRPKTVVTYRPAAVYGLRPGECVDTGPSALAFTVLSCAVPHDAEVFATFSLPATGWPGGAAARQDAGGGCASRLSGYLNPQLATADLTQQYVYPDKAAWRAGERTVICEVSAVSGKLTGSVRAQG